MRESPRQLAVARSLLEGRLVALTHVRTHGLFLLLVGGLLASIPMSFRWDADCPPSLRVATELPGP